MRDALWFEELFRTHHAAVLAYARRRVDDADDVVAEVFATAWRSREDVPDAALPWLYRTAANHLMHAYRAKARRARLDQRAAQPAVTQPDPVDAIDARLDASRRVQAALKRLSPADRELLTLLAWEELDRQEIARVVGCSVPTLRVRLRRARVRFAAHLDDLGRPTRDDVIHIVHPNPEAGA